MRALYCLLAACSGTHAASPDADVTDANRAVDAALQADARLPDATTGTGSGGDGTPTRMPCTSTFGNQLPSDGTFGRLDGYLVAIIPPSNMNGCNADASHVHLQIQMSGAVYDIAIDATDGATHTDDVHTFAIDHALDTWSEGFHTGVTLDYPTLGVHASDLVLQTKQEIVDTLNADLATANHISIYTTTYGNDGAHLVHRNGGSHDGAIVTDPLSQPAHYRLLSFSDQSF